MIDKPVYIFAPYLSQSLSISSMLKQNVKSVKICGVVTLEKLIPCKNYDEIITIEEYFNENRQGLIIPTSAITTKMFLEKNDVTIGNIVLSKNNLLVYDKITFLGLADGIGIPCPKLWCRYDDIADDEYPIFYKQRKEKGGGIRGRAKSKKDIPLEKVSELIFQEYIDSQGTYGVGFIAKDGDILCSFTHFERESIPRYGGSAVIIERYDDSRLLNYTQSILKNISYSGWGLAEYKYCKKRNDFVLMEINSKFWASCEFAFRNAPIFFELLFGIKQEKENISRMYFLDRAMERGILFVLLNIKYLIQSKKIIQNITLKEIILFIIPDWSYKMLRFFIDFLRKFRDDRQIIYFNTKL